MRHHSIFFLLVLIVLIGCVEQTVINKPTSDVETEEHIEKITVESEEPEELKVDLNNDKEFVRLQQLYNKTVNRKDFMTYSYTYYNNAFGRKATITKVYNNQVRLDLFQESTYNKDTNIQIVTFTLGDQTGQGYCKERTKCADTSKVFDVDLAQYRFQLPFDLRNFRDGVVESSEYINNKEMFYVIATSIDDGQTYSMLIDGGNGFSLSAKSELASYEWDELEINRLKPEAVNV